MTKSPVRVIEVAVGKKRYELIAGLRWHLLSETSGSARSKEILAEAAAGGYDMKVTRGGSGTEQPHVGFASKTDGAKAGQIPVAAVIADSIATDGLKMIVALPLPHDAETFLFIKVHGGVILADGDWVGTRDEIRVEFEQVASYGWEKIICPGDWSVPNSEDKDWSSFFNEETLKASGKYGLKEVTIAWKRYIWPTLLLVLVVGGGGYAIKEWRHRQAIAAALLLQQQEEAARGQRAAPAQPIKPWPLMPSPVPFARACSEALQAVGIAAGNWTVSSISCEGGNLSISWQRASEGAWISHLHQVRPDIGFTADGNNALLTRPAIAPPSNDVSEVLPPEHSSRLRIFDLASRFGLSVRIDAVQAPAAAPKLPGQVAPSAGPPVPPPWGELGIQVTTFMDPAQAAAVIDHPGFRLKKIAYFYKAGVMQYQLSGVQYVQP